MPDTSRFGLPLAAVFVAAVCCTGCGETTGTPFQPPDAPGPFRAAGFLASFTDTARNRTLTGTVWYPTAAMEGDHLLYQGLFDTGSALIGVPLAVGGPFPLVVFSHGHAVFDMQSYFLTEHLATHGFIVAACDHLDNTLATYRMGLMAKSSVDRPRDLSLMIDTLLAWSRQAGHPLEGAVDDERIGVVGHSFGGLTSFFAVGAPYDFARLKAVCEVMGEAAWTGDWWICPDVVGADYSYTAFCNGLCSLGDPRIKAAVPMAPAFPQVVTQAGMAALTVPMLIMGASNDNLTRFEINAEVFFDWATQPDTLLWKLSPAGHNAFSNICEFSSDPDNGCGPGFIDPERGWLLIRTAVTAFLNLHLSGDGRYRAYFSEPYLSGVPEVTLQRK